MSSTTLGGFGRATTILLCASLAILALACGDDDSTPTDGGPDAATTDGGSADAGPTVWDALEAARAAVRESPDHLSARADELVEARDVQGLFELVRDSVALYPDGTDGFTTNSDRTLRWGVRGTLRSGTGTPRDKAELLAELYRRAGFEATVVGGDALPDRVDTRPLLLGQTRPPFEPGEIGVDWRAIVGDVPLEPVTAVDADGSQASALADRILAAVEPELDVASFDWDLTRIPVVQVDVDGETQYANPLYPDAELGSPYTVGDATHGVFDPIEPPTVTVELWANIRDDETTTLVEASFPVADVIGRRLVVKTSPVGELEEIFFQPLEAMQRFSPSITLAGPDVTPEMVDETAVFGDAFTPQNERFTVEADGTVVGPTGPIAGERDADLEARVATVDVAADPARFPSVDLDVHALDAAGDPVEGLAGAAFEVREEGELVAAQLLENVVRPPRVLLVFDDSTSLPAEFLGTGRTAFGQALVRDLLDAEPTAEIRVASVAAGGLDYRSEWTSDVAALDTALEYPAPTFGSSDLWAALATAARSTATTTVLVTDGEAYEGSDVQHEPKPDQSAAIGAGPPAVVLQAGTPAPADDSAPLVAELTGGAVFPVTMHAEAIAAVLGFLADYDPAPYRLRYRAPMDGPSTREVTVGIEGRDVTGSSTYEVPASPDAPPTVFQGLFVTVRTSLTNTVTRRLAGAQYRATPTGQDYRDVFAALFGSTEIAVEGGPVTTAQFADDWLTQKLSTRSLVEAGRDGSLADILEATEQGTVLWPPSSAVLSAELEGQFGDTSLTFERAPRFVMTRMLPRFGVGYEQRVDILPLTSFSSAAETPEERQRATMETSLHLALVEAARYDESTVALLGDDAELVATDEVRGASVFTGDLSSEELARWNWLIDDSLYPFQLAAVPVSGRPMVLFSVEPGTGSTLALLPDGTGGGSSMSPSPDFTGTDRFFDAMGFWGSFGSPALGFWIALQKAIARQLIIAITAINNLEGVDGSTRDASERAARDFACDVGKGAVGSATGPLGEALGRIDAFDGMFGFGIPCE